MQQNIANEVKNGVQAQMKQIGSDVQNIDYEQLRVGALSVGEQDTQMMRLLADVPKVHPIFAWIAGIVNFIFPGFGTMAIGCIGDRRS